MRSGQQATPISLPRRVGLIGCGCLANARLRCAHHHEDCFRSQAVADLCAPSARRRERVHNLPSVGLMAMRVDPTISAVVKLTSSAGPLLVSRSAIPAGTHVSAEAPSA